MGSSPDLRLDHDFVDFMESEAEPILRPDLLDPDNQPKTISEFEAWCKEAYRRLQEVVEFAHAIPDELGDQPCYDAAGFVAQAGIIAVRLGAANLLEVCPRYPAMPPAKAIVCIWKCLEWCRAYATKTKATTTGDPRLDNSQVANRPQVSDAKLPERFENALTGYKLAVAHLGNATTDKDAYDWLQNWTQQEGYSGKRLPDLNTWCRYLRTARRHYGEQKYSPRRGRTGRSLVRRTDIESHCKED